MKKFLSLALAAVMTLSALLLTGCNAVKKNNVDAIKEAGKLTVFTEAGFAPYEFDYDGKIVGVDVKIMEAVAAKLGVELEITSVGFDTIVTSVQKGKVNAGAAGITINAERAEKVDFSIPYSSTAQYIIVPVGNTDIQNAQDLAGKKVGVQSGTTSDLLFDDLNVAVEEVLAYASAPVAAAGLGTKVDAVVTDKLTAEIIVANNSAYKTFALNNEDGTPVAEVEEYGICVAKGNETLLTVINEVLTELLANGSIDTWTAEYTALANELGQ